MNVFLRFFVELKLLYMAIADQKQEGFDLMADSTNQEASIEEHNACVD